MQRPATSRTTLLWQRFKSHRMAVWSLRILIVLIFIAVFGDFIANEKPLYCKIEGKHHFPVLKSYAVRLGWSGWDAVFLNADWNSLDYESVVFPPIPYSAYTQDIYNRGLVGPFDSQEVASLRWRHWMGTDLLGRDVAAGMVAGTRVAMLVGVIAMSIASVIGIFLGAAAGYFSDHRLRMSGLGLILILAGIVAGIYIGFFGRSAAFALAEYRGTYDGEVLKGFGILMVFIAVAAGLVKLERYFYPRSATVAIPVDILVMRLIEIMKSIPALLLLLAVVAIIPEPSILYVMAIIGLIRWTSIAQFLRAEMLRIRQLEYIEAARALGFSHWRIITKHALPNAITPVLITIAFGVASAILLEAFMSFLGIGVAAQEVTWGALLNDARENFSAWWLAVFPGLAIFITVTIFNLIGEGLTLAMESRETYL